MAKAARNIVLGNVLTPFNGINSLVTVWLLYVYWLTADDRLVFDSLGVVVASGANTLLAIIQEFRAHRTLEKVRVRLQVPVRKIMGTQEVRSDAADLVAGDVVRVYRGDTVPADGLVVHATAFEVDTAILTGESIPLERAEGQTVHGGSVCTAGTADLRLTASAEGSLAGKIESYAQQLDLSPSPLQRRINAMFFWSFVLAVGLAFIDVATDPAPLLTNPTRVRTVATIVLGLIPEGLVFFSTISFLFGVARIRRFGIIVQRLSALESFSEATVVCFDKTGTLTEEALRFDRIISLDGTIDDDNTDMLRRFVWAMDDGSSAIKALREVLPLTERWRVTHTIAFTSDRKFSALTFDGVHGIYTLGQAEVVFTREHPRWNALQGALHAHNSVHSRLMVMAHSTDPERPTGVHTRPLCVIVFHNRVRDDAAYAVSTLHHLGIATEIITGDRAETARATVSDMGLPLDAIPVHAECTPDDKLAIINDLKQRGEHVVMIGDGINDIPAMKRADVGVAPQQSAIATKLVADIVLESGSLRDVMPIVEEGRNTALATLSIAKLFLTKNAMLLLVIAATAAGVAPSILSPRRGALLSIMGVAIPSMMMTIWRPHPRKIEHFTREIVLYIITNTIFTAFVFSIISTLYAAHAHREIIALYSVAATLVYSAVWIERTPKWQHITIGLLTTIAASALIMLPTSVPVISTIQMFYEIGNSGISTAPALLMCTAIAMAASYLASRWVVLRLPLLR